MDAEQASRILGQRRAWMSREISAHNTKVIGEALDFAIAALKAQGDAEPVYQYKTTRGTDWVEVSAEKFQEVQGWIAEGDRLVIRTLYTHPQQASPAPETASTKDRIAWALCQIIDDDAPMRWTRYRFAAGCIAANRELMGALNELADSTLEPKPEAEASHE